ncbi:MAG TPA: hypothetical protein VLZ74_01885, partial [Methylocella sp.]|nr:hypothetical protein [Methylocella sp.]
HVAFDYTNSLGPYVVVLFVAHSHTPHDCCVRFASAVADGHATLTARQPAAALPGPDFHRLDRVSLTWRTDICTPMWHGSGDAAASLGSPLGIAVPQGDPSH